MNDIRKELSDYSDKRISYASKSQSLATEALMEIHHLDERLVELEASLKDCAECLDMQEGYEPYDTAMKLLGQQPAKEQGE